MAGGFPGNIGGASDADIFRFVVQTAQSQKEIAVLTAKLKRLRAEARATKNEANAAKAAGRALKLERGGVEIGGIFQFGRGGFSLKGSFLRGAGAAAWIFGATSVAAAVARAFTENEEVAKRYGKGEALGRVGRSALKAIFESPARMLRENFGDVLKAFGGDKDAYIDRGLSLDRFLFDTPVQTIERKIARVARTKQTERTIDAYVTDEIAFINNWRPSNVQLRTDEDIAALKKMMWDRNAGLVAEDVKNFSSEAWKRFRQESSED